MHCIVFNIFHNLHTSIVSIKKFTKKNERKIVAILPDTLYEIFTEYKMSISKMKFFSLKLFPE